MNKFSYQGKNITIENFMKLSFKKVEEEYEILDKISNGLIGDIFRVRHRGSMKIRCLKEYQKGKMDYKAGKEFLQEVEMMKHLDHPHIYKVFDFIEDDRNYYIISEFLEGGELFAYLTKEKKINEKDSLKVMNILLSIVNYLHKKNITHRDLKPENLLLAKPNCLDSLKLIDFAQATYNKDGQVLQIPQGTIFYVAPEVLLQQYDKRADVWSCGVILYMLICGYHPFSGKDDDTTEYLILNEEVQFPQEEWSQVNPQIIDLLKKMLVKNPEERFTVQQCLSHGWFKSFKEQTLPNQSYFIDKIKNIYQMTSFQKAIKLYLIQQQEWNEEKENLKEIFKAYDKNKDGELQKEELEEALKSFASDININLLFKQLDLDESGSINYTEFVMAFYDSQNSSRALELKQIFDLIDTNKNGTINKFEMKKFFNVKDTSVIDVLFQSVDTNNDQVLTFEEFLQGL